MIEYLLSTDFLKCFPDKTKKEEIITRESEKLIDLGQESREILRFTRALIEEAPTLDIEMVEAIKEFAVDVSKALLDGDEKYLQKKLTEIRKGINGNTKRSSFHNEQMRNLLSLFLTSGGQRLYAMENFLAQQNLPHSLSDRRQELAKIIFNPAEVVNTLFVFPLSTGVTLGSLLDEAYFRGNGIHLNWTPIFPGNRQGNGGKFILPTEKNWKRIILLDDQSSNFIGSTANLCTALIRKTDSTTPIFNCGNFEELLSPSE